MNTESIQESSRTARFTKIGTDGAVLPADATEWDAVLDSRTGLMWAVKHIKVTNGREKTIRAAVAKCQGIAGRNDWQPPTTEQLYCLADRTRVGPAIDTEFFPDCPSDWFWSITADCESPEGCAWLVGFSSGGSSRGSRADRGFVRAVCVGQ